MASSKKTGLGRGLAELLGEGAMRVQSHSTDGPPPEPDGSEGTTVAVSEGAAAAAGTAGVVDLPVDSIRPNPRQPRRFMDAAGLEELARSIAAVGIVQPVIVRTAGDGFELIAGERRWRAAQAAGYTFVPAIVREATDVESLELALIENVVRQELNPIDEAYALQVLLGDLGVTQEELAERVGKSRPAIANKVRLLDLAGPVQELVSSGELAEGHGRALLGLRDRGQQVRLARRAAEAGWSVRAVEAEVRRVNEAGARTAPAATRPGVGGLGPDVLDAVRDAVYGVFEVMPVVRLKGDGGRIEIPFQDHDELQRLLERVARG